MTKTQFTIIALILAVLILAGCATAPQQVIVYATPHPDELAPQINFERVQSTAIALSQRMTAEAVSAQATAAAGIEAQARAQAAAAQATDQAQAYATQAVVVATQNAAAVLQAQAEAQAAVMVATQQAAEAGRLQAEATQAAITALDLADRAEVEAADRASAKAYGDAWKIILILAGLVGVLAAGYGVNLIHEYWRLRLAVQARRDLLMLEAGGAWQFDLATNRWEALPAPADPFVVEMPAHEEHGPPWLDKLRGWRGPVAAKDAEIDAERDTRAAWVEACKRWLRWTDATGEDGDPVGMSRRRFMAATSCTRADYENARDLLLALGILTRRGNEYKLRGALTVEKALDAPAFASSFDAPEGVKVPEIAAPPAARPGPARPARPGPAHLPTVDLKNAVYASRNLAVPFDAEDMPMQ